MQEFTHKTVKIILSASGDFTANVNGKFTKKPSLKAMKDYIDKQAMNAFEPIKVLVASQYPIRSNVKDTDLARCTATAITKTKLRRGRESISFTVTYGADTITARQCWRDCPEAIAAFRALAEHEAETKRIRDEREEQESELRAAIVKFQIDPESTKENHAKNI